MRSRERFSGPGRARRSSARHSLDGRAPDEGPPDFRPPDRRSRDWRTLLPVLGRVALGYLALIPGLFALESLTGWHSGGWLAGICAGFGAAIGSWCRGAGHRRLTAAQRWRCAQVERTGVPSGDSAVDAVALRRLKERAQNHGRVLLGTILVCFAGLAGALLAAAWLRSAWWALGLLPVALIIGRSAVAWRSSSTYRERHDRLRASLPPLVR